MARPSLNDLTAFVAVATHRNFRRAADEIGTAPSTLSHAMRALEERMGVRLLNRTTRSVSPTEAGYQLLGRLQPALASLDEALDSVAGFRGKVAGTVRINAPRLAAGLLVRSALPRMAELHPDVTVDIVVEGRLIDIVSGGFDAGVRPLGSVPKDMITVLLARPLTFICVASPTYLDRFGEPRTPEELRRHRCIGHRMPSGKLYRWEFERAGQELALEANGTIVLDDEELMVEAAIEGLGVAYVADWAVEAALSEGSLRKILTGWVPTPEEVAVYYPGHRAVPPALRAFLDIIKELRKK
ncbi:LysR family transcriptional regulator [Mesorhizobium abyssinicae]|uniref:LysR family transcriptional regulator n=1 Tax=Mesorhizobium abyssinicae TaxID=1209958 RepID=UPI002A23B72D|nr:LysR family transcriptional regulator [Mesorhizobium abyssinicae]MDX8434360.1 LysR family transcriptional regulator [Mesorhizobium abyssinicae]